MAHTIITKNSSTAGAVPSAGSLTKGELAVNVTDRRLYTKDNAGSVVEVGSGTSIIYRDNFTGDGSTVAFTLPRTPLNEELVDIYCDGVYQGKDTFSISGAVITFDEAPLAGASIEVMTFQSSPIGETAANYVSYTPVGTGAVATTVQSKLRETVSVKDFGAVGDGVTDDTAAIQAALDYVGTNQIQLYFGPGTFLASALTISGRENVAIDFGGAVLRATGTSTSPLLTIYNSRGIELSDGTLQGTFSLTQKVLLKIWANPGGCSYCVYNSLRFRNCQYGVQLGDPSLPDASSVSEQTFNAANFIGVLTPVVVYGVQAEANFVGGQITANPNGWSVYPSGYELAAIINYGGNVRVTGGELISYSTTLAAIVLRPIASASGNLFGKVFCVGTWLEVQGQYARADNPGAVASPVGGIVSLIGCVGALLDNARAAIDTSSDFAGEIRVFDCYFWAASTRTFANINTSANAKIFCDFKSFNRYLGTVPPTAGFLVGRSALTGGTVYYSDDAPLAAVLAVQNVAQSIPNAAWTKLQFQAKTFDTDGWFDATTNYRFLPKVAGYYQINASFQINSSGIPPGIDIYKNGVSTGYAIGNYQVGVINGTATLSRLLYLNGLTDYIEIFGFQSSGGAINSVTSLTQVSIVCARSA